MEKINEQEFINIVMGMENRCVEIQIKGTIELSHKIHKLECREAGLIITLKEKKGTRQYFSIDLNNAYCTMANGTKTRAEARIDGLNNDTIVVIKLYYRTRLKS